MTIDEQCSSRSEFYKATHPLENNFPDFASSVQVEVGDAVVPVLSLSHLVHLPELQKDERLALGHDPPAQLHYALLRYLRDAQHVHVVLRVEH